MNINSNRIVSISEANQNFSKVARMADKYGALYIFKNNKPKYKLIDIEEDTSIEMTDDEKTLYEVLMGMCKFANCHFAIRFFDKDTQKCIVH